MTRRRPDVRVQGAPRQGCRPCSDVTRITVNFAAISAARGFRTLVVDLDPQCNASQAFSVLFDALEGKRGEGLSSAWPARYIGGWPVRYIGGMAGSLRGEGFCGEGYCGEGFCGEGAMPPMRRIAGNRSPSGFARAEMRRPGSSARCLKQLFAFTLLAVAADFLVLRGP